MRKSQPLLARSAKAKDDSAVVAAADAEIANDNKRRFGNARPGRAGPVNVGKRNALPMEKKKVQPENLAVDRLQVDPAPRDAAIIAQADAKSTEGKTESKAEKEVAREASMKPDLLQQAREAFARHEYAGALDLISQASTHPRSKAAAQTAAILALKADCELKLGHLDAAALTIAKLQKQAPATAASLARKLQTLQSAPAKPRKSSPPPRKNPARKFSTDAYDE